MNEPYPHSAASDRRSAGQSRHAGGADRGRGPHLSQGISVRSARDRAAGTRCGNLCSTASSCRSGRASRRAPTGKSGTRERDESPLKTITRAQAEKLAQLLAPERNNIVVDWAMRYGSAVDRLAHRFADARGLRPHSGGAALSAICRRHDRDGRRRSVQGADAHARAAGAAHRAALLRRSGLYRCAGDLAHRRASRRRSRRRKSCLRRFTAFRRNTSTRAIPTRCIAR